MNVTRRFFLKSSAALAATYCGITPARLLAEAGLDPNNLVTVRKSKTLVAIFLRGGMDGLNFIVPFKDPGYYQARRNLALSEPGKDGGVVDLDGFFGLHPRAAALAPLFQKGQAVALQAVGYSLNTRLALRGTGHLGNRRQRQHAEFRRLAQPPPAHQPGPRTHPRREHRRHPAAHPARQGPGVLRARDHRPGSVPRQHEGRLPERRPGQGVRRPGTRLLLRPARVPGRGGSPRRPARPGFPTPGTPASCWPPAPTRPSRA